MTPEEARADLLTLLGTFTPQLDALDALVPGVQAQDATAISQYLAQIAITWPAGIAQEDAISALQEQCTDPVLEVDTFWTRLHQRKQLGVSLGYQPS